MSKYKLIFLGQYNNSEILTGPEKVAKRVFAEFTKTDDSVFLTYFQDSFKHSRYKKLFGRECIAKINNSPVYSFGIFPLILFLIKFNPDIIHIINYSRFSIFALLYKIIYRVKIIFNIHGVIKYEYGINNFNKLSVTYLKDMIVEYCFVNISDRLLFLTKSSVKLIKQYYSISNEKITFIKNGIDNYFFENLCFNKDPNMIKIVYISADDNYLQKGVLLFREITEKLNFKTNIYIIGGRETTKPVYNKNINYIFIEKMPSNDFKEFLRDKHIILSTSVFDTYQMAIIESMASSLIPVVGKNVGISYLICDRYNGFLIEDNCAGSFIDALNKIKDNYEYYYTNISKTNLDFLKWNLIIKDYIKIYTNI